MDPQRDGYRICTDVDRQDRELIWR